MCGHDDASADPGVAIRWRTGEREELRDLFTLAEDSSEQLDGYLHMGRVFVAVARGSIVGYLQLVDCDASGEIELKSMAIVSRRQRSGMGAH